MSARRIVTGFCALVVAAQLVHAGTPLARTFNYQGQLKRGPMLVNEGCEFIFTLYDAPADGQLLGQMGTPAVPIQIDVAHGLFSVELDFPAAPMTGEQRWLEIAVRTTAAGGDYVALTPRHRLGAAPYALHAMSGGDVTGFDQAYNKGGPGAGRTVTADHGPMSIAGPDGLTVDGKVGIGTASPQSKLEVAGMIHSSSEGFKFPDGTIQTTASQGPLPPLPASAGCLDGPGGAPVDALCIDGDGDVGIGTGTTNINANLHVTDPDDVFMILAMDNNNVGTSAGAILFNTGLLTAPTQLAEIVVDEGVAGSPLDLNSSSTRNVRLALGGGNVGVGVDPANRLSVLGDADVFGFLGVGTTTPQNAIHATGFLGTDSALDDGGHLGLDSVGDAHLELVTNIGTPYIDWLNDNANDFDARLILDGDDALSLLGASLGIGITPGAGASLDVTGAIRTDDQLISTVVAGTAPLDVTSNTLVTNLNADLLDGNDVSAFALAAHTHDGADIVSGIVTEPRIDPLIARDAEVLPIVLAGDGSGSGLDADLLDSLNSTAFAILGGQATGQTLNGGIAAGENLTLDSTSNAVKGDVLIAPTDGQVGIGNVAPVLGSKLDVTGNVNISGILSVDTVTSHSPLVLQAGGTPLVVLDDTPNQVAVGNPPPSPPAFPLDVNGSIHTNMDLLADDNLGVGTTTPGEKIDVVGGNIRTDSQLISTVGAPTPPLVVTSMQLVTNLNADKLDDRHEIEFALLAGRPLLQRLHGGTAAMEDLILDSTSNATKGFVLLNPDGGDPGGGSVGIGTSTPTEALEVIGDGKFSGSVITSTLTSMMGNLSLQTAGTEHIIVNGASGNVGIGSPPPNPIDEALHVAGCIKADCLKITADTIIEVSPLRLVKAGTGIEVIANISGTSTLRCTTTGPHFAVLPVDLPSQILGTGLQFKDIKICYKVGSTASFITATHVRFLTDAGTSVTLVDNLADQTSRTFTCYNSPAPLPLQTVTGPVYIAFDLTIAGTTPAHDIEIGRVSVTLSQTP
jgi:hypothetical protein